MPELTWIKHPVNFAYLRLNVTEKAFFEGFTTAIFIISFIALIAYCVMLLLKTKRNHQIIKEKEEEITRLQKESSERTKELELALQKAEEANRLKSLFLSNISHEIRTPLNSIMGFSELITEDDTDQTNKAMFASQIVRNSQNLLNLIDQIFHLAIFESGHVTVYKEEFVLGELLNRIEQNIKTKIIESKKNIKLIFNTENPEYTINTDKSKLMLIFENLLGNALKFTKQGIIECTCVRMETHYHFQIADSGCGLNEDEYDLIFDPFTQGSETLKRIKGGSGLGLSNVKNFVNLLGGKIWCAKNKPLGSIFYFTLPTKRIKEKELHRMIKHSIFKN